MKTYALRIERAEEVLSQLMPATANRRTIKSAYTEFVDVLLDSLMRGSLEPVHIDAHDFDVLEHAKARLMQPNIKYLCFDSQSRLGIPFGVSRNFDLISSKQLGIVSRPGYASLQEQINKVKHEYGNRFGLIEDDIYTGTTVRTMIELLEQNDITVTSIICGISSTRAVFNIPVQAVVYYDPSELLELTDPRDYIFGAREGGLVTTCQHMTCRVPYDAAFIDVMSRSSLRQGYVETFTQNIRSANLKLHTRLGSLQTMASQWYSQQVLNQVGFDGAVGLKDILTSSQIVRRPRCI